MQVRHSAYVPLLTSARLNSLPLEHSESLSLLYTEPFHGTCCLGQLHPPARSIICCHQPPDSSFHLDPLFIYLPISATFQVLGTPPNILHSHPSGDSLPGQILLGPYICQSCTLLLYTILLRLSGNNCSAHHPLL